MDCLAKQLIAKSGFALAVLPCMYFRQFALAVLGIHLVTELLVQALFFSTPLAVS